MTLFDFLRSYRYGRRGTVLSGWLLLDDDKPVGDCEDFALTVLYHIEGRSWLRVLWAILTFRARFWFVDSPAGDDFPRHTILYHRSHGWIDSLEGYRHFRDAPEGHQLYFPWLWLAFPLILWGAVWKRVFGNQAGQSSGR